MNAYLHLRYASDERARLFIEGLKKHGYNVIQGLTTNPKDKDILVVWNRIGKGHEAAKAFERNGNLVLVSENATFGNSFAGKQWYTIARNYHNTSKCFDVGDAGRWDSLGVELPPFRAPGETVILPQRGIGTDPVRMPSGWAKRALSEYGGRVRKHPGKFQGKPLDEDLKYCGRVITWGSGAAVKALLMGIKVTSEYINWIATQDNTEQGRLDMFRKLIWAQWTHEEISNGFAFDLMRGRG